MSPSDDSDTTLSLSMAASSTRANGRAKNTNIIQFSENIHQTKTKKPTPMCTTLRTFLSPRLSRIMATASDTAMIA